MTAMQDIISLAFWTGFAFGMSAGFACSVLVASIVFLFHLRSIGK